MQLYTADLLKALEGIPGVVAQAQWPAFGQEASVGKFRKRWIRHVQYVRWCRSLSGDLFHVTDHGNAQLLLALPGTRTVVTCHDLYPVVVALGRARFAGAESRWGMTPTALRLQWLRKAAAIVAISQQTLEECRNFLGIARDRLFLAPYGISRIFHSPNGSESPESFRRRHNIPVEPLVVLHVGSNDPRKNLMTVFGVVAALRERCKKGVCLVKVGSPFGPLEAKAIKTLGLQEAIRDLGPLSAEETARAYRACDVLLYPSFHEGFCRPVAEAMASGTPVVASNRGAIPEVVQHSPSLFEPEDVEGMTSRILQIIESDDLRDELVQRGRLAAQKFTWEAHGAAVAEVYRNVVKRWA